MKKKVGILIASIVCVFTIGFNSSAVTYNSPLINMFGQTGVYRSHSAITLGMGRLAIGGYANYSSDHNFVHQVTGFSNAVFPDSGLWTDTLRGYNPDITVVNSQLFLGYGITRFLDFSAAMPIYYDYLSRYSSSTTEAYGYNQGGFGDLELALKFQYPPYPHKRIFKTSYYGAVTIPTGNRRMGLFPRHTYYLMNDTNSLANRRQPGVDSAISLYSSGAPEIDMKMLWTIDLGGLHEASPIFININYGVRWTRKELPNLFLLNISFDYNPLDWLHFFTEFSGETRIETLERGFRLGDDPLRLSPGISFTPVGGFFLTLGADINLSSDTLFTYQMRDKRSGLIANAVTTRIEPQYRIAATIGWAGYIIPQDADQDGIRDNEDKCPNEPEDFDNFEDTDGCPDLDNDHDGIADLKDKCPNDAEDVDGFEDLDGCPDFDNDKDMVVDTADKCPIVAEDIDGFEDTDGCPDFDNDRDGIADSSDQCINLPEDKDNFQDRDGCPDTDNDLDIVPDSVDNCPDVPGDIDNNGCPKPEEKPKAKEIQRGRVILRGVNFEFGSANLTQDSYAILERVRDSLIEWPEVKIEIMGHTDSVGGSLANRRLSQLRSEAVRDYLVSQGVSPDRLIAIGKGEEEPIADNTTSEGRQMNRRVELHRID
jgi:outer membrane protein OmpA-like peptidoglycan-associated protein